MALGGKIFQHFSFVIHGTPKIVRLAVDLHENFVQVPLPIGIGAEIPDAVPADLGREDRAKPIPPKSHRLVADVFPTLVKKILHIPERKREPDVQHHRQADDLRLSLE